MFNRQVSFFKVTEYQIRIVDSQRQVVPVRTWLAPGLTSAAVHGYFNFSDNIQVSTSPIWLDLHEIFEDDGPCFQFNNNNSWFAVGPNDIGYGYLQQYYADFLKEFLDQYYQRYDN